MDSQPTTVDDDATRVWHRILEADADDDGDSDDSTEHLLVVGPSFDVLTGLVGALRERIADESTTAGTSRPRVMVLASKSVLKVLRDSFTAASHTAELLEADTLALRTSTKHLDASLAVTDIDVFSLVETGNLIAAINTDDEAFVEAVWEKYRPCWKNGEPFDLRTPALSRVQTTLEADLGSDVWATFDELRRAFDDRETNGSPTEGPKPLIAVDLVLLAAATHERMLYNLGMWAEDVGLASRATVSRKKKRLEGAGVLDTKKVPMDLGRPRQRLLLGERVRGMDADELVASLAER